MTIYNAGWLIVSQDVLFVLPTIEDDDSHEVKVIPLDATPGGMIFVLVPHEASDEERELLYERISKSFGSEIADRANDTLSTFFEEIMR